MVARRCPRMLALLLAAAAPAGARRLEAAHEWAGLFDLEPDTYTWRAQKARDRRPALAAEARHGPRAAPRRATRPLSHPAIRGARTRGVAAHCPPHAENPVRVGGRLRAAEGPQVLVDRAEDGR